METPAQGIPIPADLVSAAEGGAPYAVKLPIFEGPLDLLLHLIRLNEVEITDIPIARVCEQYLAYLDVMRELNIDVASEYLVMAATLRTAPGSTSSAVVGLLAVSAAATVVLWICRQPSVAFNGSLSCRHTLVETTSFTQLTTPTDHIDTH